MVVGASVGVALGVSGVGRMGVSLVVGEGSSVGFGVWVGARVGILVGGVEAVVVVVAGSGGKLGTYRCCPV